MTLRRLAPLAVLAAACARAPVAVPGPEKTVAIPVNDFWTKEVRVLTSYYCGPPDIQEAMGLLAERAIDVDRLITHRLPLAETARGFGLVLAGIEAIKVIIKP